MGVSMAWMTPLLASMSKRVMNAWPAGLVSSMYWLFLVADTSSWMAVVRGGLPGGISLPCKLEPMTTCLESTFSSASLSANNPSMVACGSLANALFVGANTVYGPWLLLANRFSQFVFASAAFSVENSAVLAIRPATLLS